MLIKIVKLHYKWMLHKTWLIEIGTCPGKPTISLASLIESNLLQQELTRGDVGSSNLAADAVCHSLMYCAVRSSANIPGTDWICGRNFQSEKEMQLGNLPPSKKTATFHLALSISATQCCTFMVLKRGQRKSLCVRGCVKEREKKGEMGKDTLLTDT